MIERVTQAELRVVRGVAALYGEPPIRADFTDWKGPFLLDLDCLDLVIRDKKGARIDHARKDFLFIPVGQMCETHPSGLAAVPAEYHRDVYVRVPKGQAMPVWPLGVSKDELVTIDGLLLQRAIYCCMSCVLYQRDHGYLAVLKQKHDSLADPAQTIGVCGHYADGTCPAMFACMNSDCAADPALRCEECSRTHGLARHAPRGRRTRRWGCQEPGCDELLFAPRLLPVALIMGRPFDSLHDRRSGIAERIFVWGSGVPAQWCVLHLRPEYRREA